MLKYITRRLLLLIPTIIGVSFIVFTLLHFSPGDAATAKLGADVPQEAIEATREAMGLNDPFIVQYGRFLKGFILKFDLGRSYITNEPVTRTLMQLFPNTLRLSLFALTIAVVLGMSFGIIAAIKKYSIIDNITMIFGLVGLAMPIFWSGLLLILFFSVKLKWFPSSGFSTFRHMILPGLALGFQSTAIIMRMTRSSMLEVLDKDYIRTARAKGLRERSVIAIHSLKNAMIPVVTTIGLQMGGLLGGSVLTETIFAIPGIGRLMVDSIKTRDYPIVLGGVMFIAITYSLISLIVDILYGYIDPKVKSQYR